MHFDQKLYTVLRKTEKPYTKTCSLTCYTQQLNQSDLSVKSKDIIGHIQTEEFNMFVQKYVKKQSIRCHRTTQSYWVLPGSREPHTIQNCPHRRQRDWSDTQGHTHSLWFNVLSQISVTPESDSAGKQKQLIVFTFCFLFIAKSNPILVFFMSAALFIGCQKMSHLKVTGQFYTMLQTFPYIKVRCQKSLLTHFLNHL